jgi:hypothetical protein
LNLLDTTPDRVRAEQLQRLQMEAQRLATYAEKNGFALTVRVEPGQIQAIDVRETRHA